MFQSVQLQIEGVNSPTSLTCSCREGNNSDYITRAMYLKQNKIPSFRNLALLRHVQYLAHPTKYIKHSIGPASLFHKSSLVHIRYTCQPSLSQSFIHAQLGKIYSRNQNKRTHLIMQQELYWTNKYITTININHILLWLLINATHLLPCKPIASVVKSKSFPNLSKSNQQIRMKGHLVCGHKTTHFTKGPDPTYATE